MMSAQLPSPTFTPPSSSFISGRKRAASPNYSGQPDLSLADDVIPSKKRRPNLANGFSSLSLTPKPPHDGQADSSDDDDISHTRPRRYSDVRVELLPDTSSRPSWSMPNHASTSTSPTSSTTSIDDAYDSDVTFRLPRQRTRRFADIAQQADTVEPPPEIPPGDTTLSVEDVTLPSRKRREADESDGDRRKRRKRGGGMDVDMDGTGFDEEIEEIRRTRPRRRKTQWHEPEKDRIVITQLSSSSRSSSSDRSTSDSPHPGDRDRDLSQPGDQGFTLSPSLLTQLLNAQRNEMTLPDPFHSRSEKGLVLYRPLGIPPGGWPEVVRKWAGSPRIGEPVPADDTGRFEEVDDDEDLDMDMGDESTRAAVPRDLGDCMPSQWARDEDAMELE